MRIFDRLHLGTKFTLLLALVFLAGMVLSWFALSQALQSKAEREVVSKAQILLKTMNSVRQYTTENINRHVKPLLDTRAEFISETVPGYSAFRVFQYFRSGEEYRDFRYKEATLNPTNPVNLADGWEAALVERFRRDPGLEEQSGFHQVGATNLFYTARPIRIKSASCLECHSTPAVAPASMVRRYGDTRGFGWQMDEVVGSQIVYVPADAVFSAGQHSAIVVTGIFLAIFALAALAITVFFRRVVVRPLGGLAAATQALSRGNAAGESHGAAQESGKGPIAGVHGDELGQLAERFAFMAREVYSREERLRQARAEVARSEAHFRSLIEYASDAVLVLGADSTVRYASPSVQRVLGRAPEAVVGQSPERFVIGEHVEAMRAALAAAAGEAGVGPALEFRCAGDGAPRHIEATLVNMLDNPAVEGIVVNMRDVTERRRAAEQIRQLALYDRLTALPNRHLFKEQLSHAIARAQRSGQVIAMLSLDLDRFKRVNDTLGHEGGDQLLREAAGRLIRSLRPADYVTRDELDAIDHSVARPGGDEFSVLLAVARAQDAAKVARRILDALSQPFTLGGSEIMVSASIGIAVYPLDGADADALLRNADAAMYYAKEQGKNNYQYYNGSMNTSAVARLALESNLHRALERGEFSLYHQPKVEVGTGAVVGVEALIRWRHPELGVISPADFIPLAEETGLIIPIGEWVLRTACAQIRAWRNEGLAPVPIAVNMSAKQFHQQDIAAVVQRALREHDVAAHLLEIEITESTAMRNAEQTSATLLDLKALGVSIAIDDFGTGYSSLSYLKRFPIDSLKIDRSFVTGLPGDQDDASIAQAVITMAHALRLKVVAEGVENEAQLQFLAANGCDEMQGYYFSRPVPAEESTRLIRERRKLPLDLASLGVEITIQRETNGFPP